MCSGYKLLKRHWLQSCVMDLWSPGVMPILVATAVRYSISCEMGSRSKPVTMHLLSVVTWGGAFCGGDSSCVREQLKTV